MTIITRTPPTSAASFFSASSAQAPAAQSASASSVLQSANPIATTPRQPELTLLQPSSSALETAAQSSSVATRTASANPPPAMPQLRPGQLTGSLIRFATDQGFGHQTNRVASTNDIVMRYAKKYGTLDFSRNNELMDQLAARYQIPGTGPNGTGATPPQWQQRLSAQLLKELVGQPALDNLKQAMAARPMPYLTGTSIQAARTQVNAELAQLLKSDFPVANEYSNNLLTLAEQLAPIVRPDSIIYRQDLSSEVANGARQWIELMTGMQLASQLGVDPQRLSSAQLLELVQVTQAEETKIALAHNQQGAQTTPAVPTSIAQYKLALLAQAHNIDLRQEGSADKLEAVIKQAFADEIQTIAALDKIGQQPPSRKQMAIDIFHAAGLNPYENVPRLGAGKYAEQAAPKYLYEEYMAGSALHIMPAKLWNLPNLNDEFDKRFNAFTDTASSGLRDLLQAQLSRRFGNTALSNDTRFKFHTPTLNYTISRPAQSVSAIEGGNGDSGATHIETGSIDSSLAYIVEDSAPGANDPRYYWYSAETALQDLRPIDLQGKSLNQWISANKDQLFNREQMDITVKNARRHGTVGLSASSHKALGDGGLKSALQNVASNYAKELEQLRPAAYAETTDEQMLDKYLDKFLPIYGTYKAAKQGKVLEAIVSGAGDFCMLLPYVGKGIKACLIAGNMARAAVVLGKAAAPMKRGIDLLEKVQDAASKALTAFQLLGAAQSYGDTPYQPKPFQAVNTQGGWQPWDQARTH